MPVRIHRVGPLELNVQIPHYFRCPISLELMQDPVILSTGQTYDRTSIEKWVASGNTTCPVTMQKLEDFTLIPNHTLRRLIQEWCVANRSRGVERIPTPKQPADPHRLRSLLTEASHSGSTEDGSTGRAFAIGALRNLIKDSDKNRTMMVEAGAVPILIAAFFSDACEHDNVGKSEGRRTQVHSGELGEVFGGGEGAIKGGRVLGEVAEEALEVLVMLPLSEGERRGILTDKKRVAFIAKVMEAGSIEARANAGVLIEMLSEVAEGREALGVAEGVVEAVVGLVKDGKLHGKLARAGVRALWSLCLRRRGRERAIDSGATEALADRLMDAPASQISDVEKAAAALELLCASSASGCHQMANGTTAVTALVRIILKVSDKATEHAVATLLALCSASEAAQRRAVQTGLVKELLLLIQSHCTPRAKANAMSLLKLLRSSAAWLSSVSCMADYGRSDVVPF